MIMRLLRFLVPHFITRCVIRDNAGNIKALCQCEVIGDDLLVDPRYYNLASTNPTIDVVLGLSWFGYATFFWVKDSFVKV